MNKSYRTVWNEALGAWVAASEITKARGKRSRSGAVVAAAAILMSVGGADVALAELNLGNGLADPGTGAIAISPGSTPGVSSNECGGPFGGANYAQAGNGAIAIGCRSFAGGANSAIAIGEDSYAASPSGSGEVLAMGGQSRAFGIDAIAIGGQVTVESNNAIAIGGNGSGVLNSDGGTAIGVQSLVQAGSTGGVALGELALVDTSTWGTAVGRSASVVGATNGVALGYAAASRATNAVAVGPIALANGASAVALGNDGVHGRQRELHQRDHGQDGG